MNLHENLSRYELALEALAIQAIQLSIEEGNVALIVSDALAYEISRNPYPECKAAAQSILKLASAYQPLTSEILSRGQQLESSSKIGRLDALHVACAETQQVDFFITCDDRPIKRYKGTMQLCNPIEFILLTTRMEESE